MAGRQWAAQRYTYHEDDTMPTMMNATELQKAYEGSYYAILGAGGDLAQWTEGYEGLLAEEGIGKPAEWFQTTGAAVNQFAGGSDPFEKDLTILLFPLDGLETGKLAMFKLRMEDRWFDDVVQNMRNK